MRDISDTLKQDLIISDKKGGKEETEPSFISIKPSPGFVIKTRCIEHEKVNEEQKEFAKEITSEQRPECDEKVFINICTSDEIPCPREITEVELAEIVASEDPTKFRIPISLGGIHFENAHDGKRSSVYDVIIHTSFLEKCKTSDLFLGFLLTVIFEGLEAKNLIVLDRDWKKLKNKTFFGTITEQYIRKKSKPVIIDMSDKKVAEKAPPKTEKPVVVGSEPKYTLIAEPPTGKTEFMIATFQLPKLLNSSGIELDIGEDRIVLNTRSKAYHLDIYVPLKLDQSQVSAEFNKQTKNLTVTVPVVE